MHSVFKASGQWGGGAVVREKVPEGDWNRLCLIKFRHCLTERNCYKVFSREMAVRFA